MRRLLILMFALCSAMAWADSMSSLTITPGAYCSSLTAPLSQTNTGLGSFSLSGECYDDHDPPRSTSVTASATVTDTFAQTSINVDSYATGVGGPGLSGEVLLTTFLSMAVPEWAAFGRATVIWNAVDDPGVETAYQRLLIDGQPVCGGQISSHVSGGVCTFGWQTVTPGAAFGLDVSLMSTVFKGGNYYDGSINLDATLTTEFAPVPEPSTVAFLASGLLGCAAIRVRRRRKS